MKRKKGKASKPEPRARVLATVVPGLKKRAVGDWNEQYQFGAFLVRGGKIIELRNPPLGVFSNPK